MKTPEPVKLLPFLILALGLFGVLRIGNVMIGFSAATAQTSPSAVQAESPAEVFSDEDEILGCSIQEIPPGEVERRILQQLAERRSLLDAREKAIITREAVLAATEKRLEERFAAFEAEKEKLAQLRQEQEALVTSEIDALISAYERMKSKDAAAIFDALETDILVAVAAGMRTQALADVLADMQTENARKLTKLLAEKNQPGSISSGQDSAEL